MAFIIDLEVSDIELQLNALLEVNSNLYTIKYGIYYRPTSK